MRKKILWFVALTVVVSLTAVSGLASGAGKVQPQAASGESAR